VSWGGFAAVGIGAALGAWLRWGLGTAFNATLPTLPLGTLIANVVGGYCIGFAVSYFAQAPYLNDAWRLFVITGFLGGLTTFSTFSAESLGLLTRGEYGWAAAHSVAHLFGSLVAAWAGALTFRAL
jgi:fluoride exporter